MSLNLDNHFITLIKVFYRKSKYILTQDKILFSFCRRSLKLSAKCHTEEQHTTNY